MVKNQKDILQENIIVKLFQKPIVSWIILGICALLMFIVYNMSRQAVLQRTEDQFENKVIRIEHSIQERLRIYEQQLWNGVGFFYASENVDRAEFAEFVETMHIEKNWPGIQGFGYSIPVAPKQKQAHIDAIRSEGFPDYTIRPEGKRDEYTAIIYLEPFDWRNKRAFGYDMWSNPMRREAMMRARDTGTAATSGIITLVQETEDDVQKGFLTYVPMYKNKEIPDTVLERQKQFIGWIYAPFRSRDLMDGILNVEDLDVELEIYDGEIMSEESLLYDSTKTLHMNEANYSPLYEKTIKVTNQGRIWTLYVNTTDFFMDKYENRQINLIVIAGVVIELLLCYVIFSIYHLQKKARNIADKITKDLKDKSDMLIQQSENLQKEKDALEESIKLRTQDLERVKLDLERQVAERTKDLEGQMQELSQMNKTMIGREKKMTELKAENKNLKERLDGKDT